MKRRLSISGLLGALLMSAVISLFIANEFGVAAGVLGFAVLFGVPALLPMVTNKDLGSIGGLACMAVTMEVWQNHIEGNLFKNNEFLLDSTDESQYVLSGKVVHIPQAGGLPTIRVNKTFGPQTVVQRTDTDVTYNLDVYASDPIGIENAEVVELSYDKRASILTEHEASLNETIADYIITKWCPATNILRTTGVRNNDTATVDSRVGTAPGATGNRLKFGIYDLKAAKTAMDKAKVPAGDRYALMNVDMYNDLLDDLIISKYRDSSMSFDAATGAIRGTLMGFKIHQRSTAAVYDNTATPVAKAYGAATAATDNAAILFWHKGGVARAKGPTLFFEDQNNPIYQASIYSLSQRMGARIRRADEAFTLAMVEAAAV